MPSKARLQIQLARSLQENCIFIEESARLPTNDFIKSRIKGRFPRILVKSPPDDERSGDYRGTSMQRVKFSFMYRRPLSLGAFVRSPEDGWMDGRALMGDRSLRYKTRSVGNNYAVIGFRVWMCRRCRWIAVGKYAAS